MIRSAIATGPTRVAGSTWRVAAIIPRLPAASAVKSSDQPTIRSPRPSAASSGTAGWMAMAAMIRGPVRPVARPYPSPTTAVISATTPAKVQADRWSATPARLTNQAANPSRTTSSMPSAAKVSAVARRPRACATSGAASTSPVTTARIIARPPSPKVSQAMAVKTMAAVPSSSPPRMSSRFWTVCGEASGRAATGTDGDAATG